MIFIIKGFQTIVFIFIVISKRFGRYVLRPYSGVCRTNGIRTDDTRGFNKGRSSKFHEGSRVRQTPEEGRRTYRPKRFGNNNKDEDNTPKTLNDKKVQNIVRQIFVCM